jgi:hypothetical protein
MAGMVGSVLLLHASLPQLLASILCIYASALPQLFLLYIICGAAFSPLTSSQSGLHAFQFLYFFSSFW